MKLVIFIETHNEVILCFDKQSFSFQVRLVSLHTVQKLPLRPARKAHQVILVALENRALRVHQVLQVDQEKMLITAHVHRKASLQPPLRQLANMEDSSSNSRHQFLIVSLHLNDQYPQAQQ